MRPTISRWAGRASAASPRNGPHQRVYVGPPGWFVPAQAGNVDLIRRRLFLVLDDRAQWPLAGECVGQHGPDCCCVELRIAERRPAAAHSSRRPAGHWPAGVSGHAQQLNQHLGVVAGVVRLQAVEVDVQRFAHIRIALAQRVLAGRNRPDG
jgi:hypothetical protein